MNNLLYDFWKFACERQNIFYNKLNEMNPPYTHDRVLQEYKFCNAYRVLDRVSQFLLKNVIYTSKAYNYEDTVFRIILFKFFNLPTTWQYLEKEFGEITLKTFEFNKYSHVLKHLKQQQPIYNNAYISCANKVFGYDAKHDNHLKLMEVMFKCDNLPLKLKKCNTAKAAFEILKSYPLIGNFMAYQLVTDLNYSSYFNWDDNLFTVAGPGSKRGITKVFGKVKDFEQKIFETHHNQEKDLKQFGLNFKYLNNHKLQTIDIQNLFCEFDKYCRVAKPELKSNRTKIKNKYVKTKEKIDYIFPAKWNAYL